MDSIHSMTLGKMYNQIAYLCKYSMTVHYYVILRIPKSYLRTLLCFGVSFFAVESLRLKFQPSMIFYKNKVMNEFLPMIKISKETLP